MKYVFPENRFSETIFKRIGLPEDLFSYLESIFREDLFLYNCLQASTRSDAFDFLFDSQNLNPEKVIDNGDPEKLIIDYTG